MNTQENLASNDTDIRDEIIEMLKTQGLRVIRIATTTSYVGDAKIITGINFSINFNDLNINNDLDVEAFINFHFPSFKCDFVDASPFNKFKMTLRIGDMPKTSPQLDNIQINDTVQILYEIARLGNEDPKCDYSLVVKLMEEVGEFAEAFNHSKGNLPHKTMKENIEGEAADVIICALSVLARVYKDKSPNEIIDILTLQLKLKSDKWLKVIDYAKQNM